MPRPRAHSADRHANRRAARTVPGVSQAPSVEAPYISTPTGRGDRGIQREIGRDRTLTLVGVGVYLGVNRPVPRRTPPDVPARFR
jgi:hypothetical protein